MCSSDLDHDYVLKMRDGSDCRGGNWGGGKSSYLCPKMAYERYLEEDMEALKKRVLRRFVTETRRKTERNQRRA